MNRVVGTLLAGLLAGCGTIGGLDQRVKLVSQPDGAQVYLRTDEDVPPIGETNDFFELDRERFANLTLARDGYETLELELETSYRWGESFAANFLLLVVGPWGPPIGWMVDLINGSAWEYEKQDPIAMQPIHPGYTVESSNKQRVVAVTPPLADFELLSEEIADRLQLDYLESHPEDRVLGLEETGDTFTAYSWDFETHIDEDFLDALVDELDATHILESVVEEEEDELRVTVALVDVFSERVEESWELEYPLDQIESSQHGWFGRFLLSAVTIIPNSVAIDVRAPTAEVIASAPGASGNVAYNGELVAVNPWLSLLSGIRVRNVRSSVVRSNFGVGFELAPLVGLFWDKLEFASAGEDGPPDATFEWYGLTFGFGPEVGVETPIGYIYVGLYPQWGVHATHGRFAGDAQRKTKWHQMFQLEGELGYLFFVTRNFHVRLFGRGIYSPPEFWERSFANSGRSDITVESNSYIIGGISFGYYSPRIRNLTKRTLL